MRSCPICRLCQRQFRDFAPSPGSPSLRHPRTPAGIAEKLSAAIAGILKTADVTNRFRDLYATPVGSSPADTAAFFAQERERWRSVIVSAGIKIE